VDSDTSHFILRLPKQNGPRHKDKTSNLCVRRFNDSLSMWIVFYARGQGILPMNSAVYFTNTLLSVCCLECVMNIIWDGGGGCSTETKILIYQYTNINHSLLFCTGVRIHLSLRRKYRVSEYLRTSCWDVWAWEVERNFRRPDWLPVSYSPIQLVQRLSSGCSGRSAKPAHLHPLPKLRMC
jgi:hypothetical protein